VVSKIDEGSTFSFTLTFHKTKAKAELEEEQVTFDTDVKNIKVLVVEDIALNQLLMKTLLDDFGFERDMASNGKIAIELLKAKTYDVILMDLQMPEMNGFEATEYIRKEMKSNIPIIALTADVTTVDVARCKSVGMNDYVAKPVDERILFNKIITLVKKPLLPKNQEYKESELLQDKQAKCTDLNYLMHRTKNNAALMMEMIALYLKQTPQLINEMKRSVAEKDWPTLHSVIHKIIPSFSIVGINPSFETMAKTIQEFATTQEQSDKIGGLVVQLETVCGQACNELEEEFNKIKNAQQ
jgi:CheY-like chemotaxis protein